MDDLEIWTDEEARKKQMNSFDNLTLHAINGPANLAKVSTSVQDRLTKENEQMFDL